MATNLLEYKNVSKAFRIGGMLRGKRLLAVDDVSFAIAGDIKVLNWYNAKKAAARRA